MSGARSVQRKRTRKPPTADLVIPYRAPQPAAPGVLTRLRDALTPDSPVETTLLVGLALLGLGIGGVAGAVWGVGVGLFTGLTVVGALVTAIGFIAWLRPRSET